MSREYLLTYESGNKVTFKWFRKEQDLKDFVKDTRELEYEVLDAIEVTDYRLIDVGDMI